MSRNAIPSPLVVLTWPGALRQKLSAVTQRLQTSGDVSWQPVAHLTDP